MFMSTLFQKLYIIYFPIINIVIYLLNENLVFDVLLYIKSTKIKNPIRQHATKTTANVVSDESVNKKNVK